jgi:hypothetical protein
VALEVLRDCFNGAPNAPFDNPASIAVFDAQGMLVHHIQISYSGSFIVSQDTVNTCGYPDYICIEKTTYVEDVELPGSGLFTLAYQRCCRSAIIANILDPLNTGMTFFTTIDTEKNNSSIEFRHEVPYATRVNTPFVYKAAAIDIDQDSLVYSLYTPYAGGTAGINMPQPPYPPPYGPIAFRPPYSVDNLMGGDYPVRIHPGTGEITAIPGTVGVFQVGYAIEEYRDQALIATSFREFTYVVAQDISHQYLDITGIVLANEIPVTTGIVELLRRDIATDSIHWVATDTIDATGRYSFSNITADVYYLKATADTMLYGDFLPTYQDRHPAWYEATPLNLCDTTRAYRDIHLIQKIAMPGPIKLTGQVIDGQTSEPLPGIDLYITNLQGEFAGHATSDTNGNFIFNELSPGQYTFFVDIVNSGVLNDNPPSLYVSGNSVITATLYENSLALEVLVSLPDKLTSTSDVRIIPNPASDHVQISLEKNIRGMLPCLVLDGQMNTVFRGSITDGTKVQVTDWPSGVYHVIVTGADKSHVIRMVKL